MKKRWSFFIILSSAAALFAKDSSEVFDFQLSTNEHVLDQRQNYFLTSTDYRVTPKVNPTTGEYCEEEIDLIVAGGEPLSVRRFYNSRAPYDPRHASWRYNPESFFAANLEWKGQDMFAAVGDGDGSISSLTPSSTHQYVFDFQPSKNFLLFNSDGKSHPLNTQINYWRHGDPKNKHRFQYMGTIIDGSGRIRSFASPMHSWIHYVEWKEKKGNWLGGSETLWRIYASTWTPYLIPIIEEKCPNGNIISYSYTQWKEEKKNYPLPQLLDSITAYNSDKSKVLGYIHFQYVRDKHNEVMGIQVKGSDGRTAFMQHERSDKSPIKLISAKRAGEPFISYSSNNTTLNVIAKPDGRVMSTEYNAEGKVSAQYAPVGANGEMCPIGRYEYQDKFTTVHDAENNKTIYRYDDDKKIIGIEIYQGNKLYRVDRFLWSATTGNLLRKTIEDSKENPIQITEFQYDKNQNRIFEKVGNEKEWRTIKRTFSEDGYNLKLTETDREDKLVRYTYIPGTNLLSSELTYEGSSIRKRIFHTYDDCAICVKTIVDDGISNDPNDLQGVTYRKITKITPKQTIPCFGMPEVIEEKTINSQHQEISLGKIVYTYTPFGQVLQEDHYDASGKYRFSQYNTYDKNECLVSKTDPLGAKTTYVYDANHNITAIVGPRTDQHRSITYDHADRPTGITSLQTDGTTLITQKRYNKLGQVLEEIDPSNNRTWFEHDALGRVISISYPDGAIERKEYDILGNVIKETDSLGYFTTKTYNPFSQVLDINYPDGSSEHFSYNSSGTIHSHIDKNGAKTLYTYDIFDHLLQALTYSTTGQLLKSVASTWSSFQKLSESEDDLTIVYTYDFAGNKIGEQKAYQQTQYTYDTLGRLRCRQNEKVREIVEYNFCGQPIQTQIENASILQKQEKYEYDVGGNRTHVTTSQGTTKTFFNSDGKPLSVKNPIGMETLFKYSYTDGFTKTIINPKGIQTIITYDSRDREVLRLRKNAKGGIIQRSQSFYNKNGNPIQLVHVIFSDDLPLKTVTHSWEYGPLGRLERFIESEEKETRYLYDAKGRLQTIIKPNGCKLIHVYDDLGRLTRYHSTDFDYQYTYDPRNRVTSVLDVTSGTSTLRTYDPLNNVMQETLANGVTFCNVCDLQGRRTTCNLPDASRIDYSYDGIYLNAVSRNGHTHTYSQRNLEGLITEASSSVGQIYIARDAIGRYASLDAPYFSAKNYQYDSVGNLLSYNYKDGIGEANCHFTYDDLDQLIQEDSHTYRFDSILNRLKKDTYEYAINSLSQVTSDGKTSYSYDLCGNLISDGAKTYTYDSLDRLIAVQEGDHKTEYSYDPFHRRLSKTIYRGGSPTTVRFLWDGNHEIGIIDEQNRIQELRVLGEGLGAEIGAAVLFELNGKSYIPIHDHRGCVVTLIDSLTKLPIECYRYSAFGEEETKGTLSPWRFSSKRFDEETGFVFFGRRYYHPDLGRWITQDPQGFEDGPNLYAYVSNCPLNQFDLYGLRTMGQSLCNLSYRAFRTLEWAGANLLPIPYFRNFIESVGRWGAGGGFGGPSRYRTGRSEIITVPGRSVPGRSYTHSNGMATTKTDAIKQAEYISKTHGDIQVDLLYHGTEGFIADLIGCGLAKLGMPTTYNKMCANYYQRKLRDDPNHHFTSSVHSRGGIQLMNTGRFMSPEQRKHIDVLSYGSATLIPKNYFKEAENNLSRIDIVTLSNPLAFCLGQAGMQYKVNSLSPLTSCPLKVHGFLESTYAEEIARRGREFKRLYFNE